MKYLATRDDIIKTACDIPELICKILDHVVMDFDKGQLIINGVPDTITYSLCFTPDEMNILMNNRLIEIVYNKGWYVYKLISLQ